MFCLCRAYCMMKTSGSCVRVYQDRSIIDMERWELKPLRNEAWQLATHAVSTADYFSILVSGCMVFLVNRAV